MTVEREREKNKKTVKFPLRRKSAQIKCLCKKEEKVGEGSKNHDREGDDAKEDRKPKKLFLICRLVKETFYT